MHQNFGNVGDLDGKSIGFTENPISLCPCGLSVYRVRVHAGWLCIG
jgi:hypothetical protein